MSTQPQTSQPHKAKVKLLEPLQGIAYVDAGDGDAVVFVHGSMCDWRYWLPQLSGMAESYWVVAPSLRHFFPRLPSSIGRPFSWADHRDQLAQFLAKLQSPRLHLVGHSRGACVAYQLALQHPELIDSLTLVDPGGPAKDADSDGAMPPETIQLREKAVSLIEEGHVDEGLRIFVDSVSRPGFWDRSNAFFQDMARDNAQTLAPQMNDPLPFYIDSEAARIACPVLVVDGERSPTPYRHNAELLGQWMPNARRLTMTGASHGMTITHAQRFNRELTAFLRDASKT